MNPCDRAVIVQVRDSIRARVAALSVRQTRKVLALDGQLLVDGRDAIDACLAEIDRLTHAKSLAKRRGEAMFALVAHLKQIGHPFETWPDEVKMVFSEVVIDPRPLSVADIQRTRELFGLAETEGR